jgi:hypothetical protein
MVRHRVGDRRRSPGWCIESRLFPGCCCIILAYRLSRKNLINQLINYLPGYLFTMKIIIIINQIIRTLEHDVDLEHKVRTRTDYANRACNVTCNVMLVAKLVPRTVDEPSAQRTASILRSLIDRTPFHRHRDECLCCKKSNSAHNICLSLIHTRRINNSTSFRFTAVILLTTS